MTGDLDATLTRYAKVADAAVDRALRLGEQKTLKEAMRWIPMAGGKRLRPVLAMMVGEAVGGARGAKRALPLGVGLELIHNFTLVHDDIMDRSLLRRNLQTVHVKWDEATAINAGDALFARGFEVVLETPGSPALKAELVGEVAHMVRRIAEGQQWDMEFERAPAITRKDYLKMIERKTALMFATAAYGGARAAGAQVKLARDLEEYGRLLGIAFQIQDDLLDLSADPSKLGKPIGKDLRNGKRTVMVIDALETLTGEKLARFKLLFGRQDASDADVQELVGLLAECGALSRAAELADSYGAKARARLQGLKKGAPRERLEGMLHFVTSRAQ